jgi:hypothetical protein
LSFKLREPAVNDSVRFIFAIILVNVPLWLLDVRYFTGRAFFNLDLGVGICLLPLYPSGGLALIALGWGFDLLSSLSLTFHFGSTLDFLQSFEFASALRIRELVSFGTLLLCAPFLVCGIAVARVVHGHRRIWRSAIFVTALMAFIDVANGTSLLSRHNELRIPVNIAGSPWVSLGLLSLKSGAAATPLDTLPLDETAQSLVDIPAWGRLHPTGSVLFVVVESMGSPEVLELRHWLTAQLVDDQIRTRYVFREADLPFRGPTTAGELRSLCALSGSYRRMNAFRGERCLPAKMKELGWSTIGMHGFTGRVFNRNVWWPLIGLDSNYFIDAAEFGNLRCGEVFRAVCDNSLIDIGNRALRPGKRFVYLLTVNTHLPLTLIKPDAELSILCERYRQNREACSIISRLGAVLRHIKNVSKTQQQALIVVVGDHAPPFSSRESRRSFIEDKVPAFILLPRDLVSVKNRPTEE